MIWLFFQKYNWKYHLSAVLGTVIKCPKNTGSAWEIFLNKKLCFTVNIFVVLIVRAYLVTILKALLVPWTFFKGVNMIHSIIFVGDSFHAVLHYSLTKEWYRYWINFVPKYQQPLKYQRSVSTTGGVLYLVLLS